MIQYIKSSARVIVNAETFQSREFLSPEPGGKSETLARWRPFKMLLSRSKTNFNILVPARDDINNRCENDETARTNFNIIKLFHATRISNFSVWVAKTNRKRERERENR